MQKTTTTTICDRCGATEEGRGGILATDMPAYAGRTQDLPLPASLKSPCDLCPPCRNTLACAIKDWFNVKQA